MNSNAYNSETVKDLARVFKVLSEPNRLKILVSMGLECAPVSAIIARTGLSQTNVSFHLRILREAGLVKGERNGAYIFYCLYDTELLQILSNITAWREHSLANQQENHDQASSASKNENAAVNN
ncbi:transcriptional regulator, ArsR family [hydrothermal vent metagenome]|uniref:Transcriptional regulator, ArsR family n=1 Tax=hydrothermal vent metagenome TaxID=652676 RepID=A0A3B0ZT45_9ZZZZ